MGKFAGKTVLLVAENDDLDENMVRPLLRQGALLIVTSPSKRKNTLLRRALSGTESEKLVTLVANIHQPPGFRKVLAHIQRRFGGLDVIVKVQHQHQQQQQEIWLTSEDGYPLHYPDSQLCQA